MGNLIGLLACNVASCCCQSICSSIGAASKKSPLCGRLIYALILFVMALSSFLLRNMPDWIDSSSYVSWIPGFHGCSPKNTTAWRNTVEKMMNTPDISVPEQLCYGTMSVYRVSFALVLFHSILGLVMINIKLKSDPRDELQTGWWAIKLLVLSLVAVGAFFIPNVFYLYYGWVALFGSGIFILIQLILLVDFAHSWTEKWVGYYEKSQSRCWAAALIIATAAMYLISLTLTVLMYIFFMENSKECWFNPMFVTLNIVLCFVISIASIHPKLQEKNPRAGLLQASVVTAYSTYLVWSALSSEPASMKCSKFPIGQPGQSQDGLSITFGLIFTFLAIVYSALRVSTSSESLSPEEKKEAKLQKKKLLATLAHEDEQPPAQPKEKSEKDGDDEEKQLSEGEEAEEEEDDQTGSVTYNYSFFHLTFLLAAMYLSMVLTNWQSVSIITGQGISDNTIMVDQGITAVWVKMVSSWVTLLLFFWTLMAPIVLPNRKFWD